MSDKEYPRCKHCKSLDVVGFPALSGGVHLVCETCGKDTHIAEDPLKEDS